ncbi:ketopantoate reductase family protein [Virgibacillus xinjiangensis]|uniref:2-dehydropantoate 2-reductase n=1 Tax=Virgibacillus xinjiangensis TaxID=393090 RepID=A0ABV7CYP0_9BACI
MKKIKTVTLVGLGAIGAAYGSRLQQFLGESFKVVADTERVKRYTEQGIRVNGEEVPFRYISSTEPAEPADLVIFAVKNAELPQAIENARNHIGENTIILSLLNGVSSEEEIRRATGNAHILYSMCVEIAAVRDGQNIHYHSIGRICFGDKEQYGTKDEEAVRSLFEDAGIPYEIPQDIMHTIWAKFMFNVGINQTSAVLKARYHVFQQLKDAHEWVESAMYEVVKVAEREGIHLTEKDVHSYRPILHNLSPDGQTSMLQDVVAKRKTEVEYFAGKVCELGKKHGIPTPVNEQLYKIIRIMEQSYYIHSPERSN